MRPLILSRSLKKYSFEEERIRKNIKSSLESIKLNYTTNIFDDFDIIHFINWKSLKEIKEAKNTEKPVILSAFYSELDKKSSYIKFKNNEICKNKYLKIFEAVDLVLVPSVIHKKYLSEICPSANIEVFNFPVKFESFKLNNVEKKLMFRYYTERENSTIILCVGDYENKKEIENLIEISSLCKKYKFYFLGSNYSSSIKKKYEKKIPKNVVLDTFIDIGVYKSLLLNSKVVLNLNINKLLNLISYNAMAVKIPLISIGNNLCDDLNKFFLIANGTYNTALLVEKCINNKIETKVNYAFNYIKKYNLLNSGNSLKLIYKKLLNK